MSEASDKLSVDADALDEIAAALTWIGAVANNDNAGSGDEALANAATLTSVAVFVRSVAAAAA